MTGMWATIAHRITETTQAPMYKLNLEADVTATTELMAKLVVDWRQYQLRSTYQDLVLANVARALKDHPCASAYFIG